VARYLRILRRRAALIPFLAAVVARLPVSMGPLAMVILVQHVRGTYSIAGLVTAAFALGAAVAAPMWGRLMDHRGQPPVIGPTSAVSAALLALLAVSAVGGAPGGVLVVIAAGVGLTFPPMSPAMRGAWRTVLSAEEDRRAAYALDAVAMETIFVGGPLLLSLLLVLAAPVVPLLVTALLLAVGGVGYACTGAARAWRPGRHPHHSRHDGVAGVSPLRVPVVVVVLAVAAALAVGFGLCDVSIAATAREVLGSQARVGVLFAAIAGGSAVGGLWYGSRGWHRAERQVLPVTLGAVMCGLLALGTLLLKGQGDPVWLLPLLFCTGLCIAPSLIMFANLIDHYAPGDRLGEAQSWLNTAFTSGGALGTAAAGVLVDTGGPARGFLGAATAVGMATVVALTRRGARDRRQA
jgi:MFS family permease